jgi:hypothetical protein
MYRYQDALLPGTVIPGERDCRERWELIAPYVPTAGIIVDVGSNLGYYGIRAARSSPKIAVVSIEADRFIAERQQAILHEHDISRITLVQGQMSGSVSSEWAATCDWVQLTLLLSVLHWVDEPEVVARNLASVSAQVIAEVPDPDDESACGKEHTAAWGDPVEWFQRVTGREARLIGRPGRARSTTKSHLVLVDGPISRNPTLPYWGSEFKPPDQRVYNIEFDGKAVTLRIRGKAVSYRPGINFVSLMKLGRLLYPDPAVWLAWGQEAFARVPTHADPLPNNTLWNADGLQLIDTDDERIGDPNEGLRSLRANLRSWVQNRSAARAAYVPRPWQFTSYIKHAGVRFLRRFMSDDAIWRIKRTLHI